MHECPDCGRLCTCGGDIDDIDWGEWNACECRCEWEDEGPDCSGMDFDDEINPEDELYD